MRSVSLLIKPASSLCNMRCKYCFYDDVCDNRSVKSMGFLSAETAEHLVRSAFESVEDGGDITFAFQGGEPTLAGLDFFQTFLALEQKYRRPGVRISHAIQTNGYALDEAWADFFRTHNFLVGLSLDGTKDIHDLYRLDAGKKGTWNRVVHTLNLLRKKNVEVNLLCVVTAQCARSPQKVYASLKRLGVRYLQFIACLDPLDEARGERPYSLAPLAYGKFLCGLFDAWYLDWKKGDYVSIRLFDDYIHLMMGMPSGSCATSGSCGSYLVAEGDGSLYPCDFYVLDQWKLGKLPETSLSDAATSSLAQRFLFEGRRYPDSCEGCPWLPLCNGGCKRDWTVTDGRLENYYCPAFRQFFAYTVPRMREVALAEASLRGQLSR